MGKPTCCGHDNGACPMTFRLAVLNIPTSDQLCSGTERGRLRLSPQVWWDRRGGRPHSDRSGRSRLHIALNMRIVCATVGLFHHCAGGGLARIIGSPAGSSLRGVGDHQLHPAGVHHLLCIHRSDPGKPACSVTRPSAVSGRKACPPATAEPERPSRQA
jgi:hypothetical protein